MTFSLLYQHQKLCNFQGLSQLFQKTALSPNETISLIANSFNICSKPQVAKVTSSGAHARGLPRSSASYLLLHSLPAWPLSSHRGALGRCFVGLGMWVAEGSRGQLSVKHRSASKSSKAHEQERDGIAGSLQSSDSESP